MQIGFGNLLIAQVASCMEEMGEWMRDGYMIWAIT